MVDQSTLRTGDDAAAMEFDVERVLRVLRRRWSLILACVVILGAAAFAYTRLTTKEYTSTASLLFGNNGLQQEAAGVTGASNQNTSVTSSTNALLLRLGPTAAAAAAQIGHGVTTHEVSSSISVSPQGQTNVINVSATSPNPKLAAEMASAFVTQFISAQRKAAAQTVNAGKTLVEKQYRALSREQKAGPQGLALADRVESLSILAQLQTGNVQLVQAPAVPTSPSSPKVTLDILGGLLGGLILGIVLAFVLERLDHRLRKVDDIEEAFGYTVLGHIQEEELFAKPRRREGSDELRLVPEAEAFRMLRAHLRYYNVDRDLRTILVTSIAPGDGKTTIAHNLAEAAASMGTKTLLVEADLRRPQLSGLYDLRVGPGLADVLISHDLAEEAEAAIQSVPIAGTRINGHRATSKLDVLVAGPPPPNPSELLESVAMQGLLSWAADRYELVLIDAPPAALVSDAIPLVSRVNGVVVVTGMGQNTRDSARRFHKTLKGLGAPVLGVIVNRIKSGRDTGYGYGYGYGYTYGERNGHATRNGTDVLEDPADKEPAGTAAESAE